MGDRQCSEVHLSRTVVRSDAGMVVTGHALSAEAGAEILEDGGNAFDSAAAAIFASWVVEPGSCGLGGIGRGVVYHAETNNVRVLSATGRVPAAATEDMFELEEGLDPWGRWRKVKGDANMIGPKSPMVPGMLAGVCSVLAEYGTMSLKRLLQPAIRFAQDGIPMDGYEALQIGNHLDKILKYPATAEIFAPSGVPPRPGNSHQTGSILTQADLAMSLERIAAEGPQVFYGGEIAQQIERHLTPLGGILTAKELADFTPEFDAPGRTGSYREHELVWSDGYFVNLILNVLEHFDLKALDPGSPQHYHLVIEAMRYAFGGLLTYLADPNIIPSPVEGLWSKSYAAEIAYRIDPRQASNAVSPVDPWPHETRLTGQRPPKVQADGRGLGSPGTTQVIAADDEGNVGSFNITHSGAFGSMVTVPGTGILLNGAMTSMDPEPGKANSIHPERRAMSFSAPVLVLKGGRPRLAFSGSGGRTIISCQAQVICHVLNHGMGAQEAIEFPRVHCETREAFVDRRVGEAIIRELRSMGHPLRIVEETFHSPYFSRPVAIESHGEQTRYHSGISPHHRTAAIGL